MKKIRNNNLVYLIIVTTFVILFMALIKTISTTKLKNSIADKQHIEVKDSNNKEELTNVSPAKAQASSALQPSDVKEDDFSVNNQGKVNNELLARIDLDPKSISVPVLMYHSINVKSTNEIIITPEEFENQIKWLNDNGFTPIFLDELYSILTTGKAVPPKPIVLTFDDGYEDNYTKAYPILKKYNFKATIFLITKTIGQACSLTENQIKEMYANNIDFQSHTASHYELNSLSFNKQLKELIDSKNTISNLLNKSTEYLCYPVGKYNDDTIKAAKAAGYKMAFSTKQGHAKHSDCLYKVKRVRMWPGINMKALS